jgi:putative redox protein
MTAGTVVRWFPPGKRFISTDSTGHSVILSTTDEGFGMKPSELILSALAGCTSVDVVEILAKKQTPFPTWKCRPVQNRTLSRPGPFARST